MRDSEFKTLLTGLLELKNKKPKLSNYQRELVEAIKEEAAQFLEEDEKLKMSDKNLKKPFDI